MMKVYKISQIEKQQRKSHLFTGPVEVQSIIGRDQSKMFRINQVNFGMEVRNKFHSHTSDQILIVTKGEGIVATEKEGFTVFPGDIIFIPHGETHRHGAAKDSTFSHLTVMSPDSETTQIEK